MAKPFFSLHFSNSSISFFFTPHFTINSVPLNGNHVFPYFDFETSSLSSRTSFNPSIASCCFLLLPLPPQLSFEQDLLQVPTFCGPQTWQTSSFVCNFDIIYCIFVTKGTFASFWVNFSQKLANVPPGKMLANVLSPNQGV